MPGQLWAGPLGADLPHAVVLVDEHDGGHVLAGLGVVRAAQSVRRAMDLDERIIRVGPRHWALAEPGRREYTGLRDAITEALEEAGHPLSVPDLVAAMRVHYVVATHSVRVYVSREPFRTVDGLVSIAE